MSRPILHLYKTVMEPDAKIEVIWNFKKTSNFSKKIKDILDREIDLMEQAANALNEKNVVPDE